mmetsp:Transcript_6268/g.7942  ORF Transcript_6268/g.7942 Transcript_6268/m.7942 type:complete len:323 (-) Transcript_6268:110-1078(-)
MKIVHFLANLATMPLKMYPTSYRNVLLRSRSNIMPTSNYYQNHQRLQCAFVMSDGQYFSSVKSSNILNASALQMSPKAFRYNRSQSFFTKRYNRSSSIQFSTNTSNNDDTDERNSYPDCSNESKDEIINKTKKWIQDVVIGLNFCPFADKSLQQSKIFTVLIQGDDIEEILSTVLYESILRKDENGTTVIICPDLYATDFEKYLDVVAMLEQILEESELQDDIQIAPFHPLFQFEGSDQNGIDNFTNRSPYPIFHILREEEVAAAVRKINGDSSKVYQRNIDFLEKLEELLGRESTEKVMKGEKVEGLQEILKNNNLGKWKK